jgi:hypothetical protein
MKLIETDFARWSDYYVGLVVLAALSAVGFVALELMFR